MEKILNIITTGKYHKFKRAFATTIISYAAFIVGISIVFARVHNDDQIIPIFIILNSCLFLAIVVEIFYYYFKFMLLKASIKLSMIDGSWEFIDEITGKNYETNEQIAFSEHFFYDLKLNMFIAYDSIIWIYQKDGATILRAVNGKKFRSLIDADNLRELIKANPHVIVGYNSNNYRDYSARVSSFKAHKSFNAETIVFDIPNTINNFWKWVSSKVHSKVFYTIGFTCEALFLIGLIIIANVDSPSNRIANWVFGVWCPSIFLALLCLWIGHKVEGYEPKVYKTPKRNKTVSTQRTATTVKKEVSTQRVGATTTNAELPKTKKCKFCKKDFPVTNIDANGYCPHCAENWWKA